MHTQRPKSIKEISPVNIDLRSREDEALGTYIRRVRLMRGMSLAEVAHATPRIPESRHISFAYLSQIEVGRALHPSRERLLSIAEALGVPPTWLLEKAGLRADTAITPEDLSPPSPLLQQIALRAEKLERSDQEAFLRMIDAVIRLRRTRRNSRRKNRPA